MNRIELPQELKSRAFDLMSNLGMTIENRKFHACAQIGYPHVGYCRYSEESSDQWALYMAVIQCADSYYLKNPDEKEVLSSSTEPLHGAYIQCAKLAGKVADLEAQLAEKTERLKYWENRARSHEDEDGCPLHEIHRAYGVESVDKGVSDHE